MCSRVPLSRVLCFALTYSLHRGEHLAKDAGAVSQQQLVHMLPHISPSQISLRNLKKIKKSLRNPEKNTEKSKKGCWCGFLTGERESTCRERKGTIWGGPSIIYSLKWVYTLNWKMYNNAHIKITPSNMVIIGIGFIFIIQFKMERTKQCMCKRNSTDHSIHPLPTTTHHRGQNHHHWL